MTILFLGTGAADWPTQRPESGEWRRFSSVLIDGNLLIDPGPAVPDALEELGIRPDAVRCILNTHRHPDHYSEDTLHTLTGTGAVFYDLTAGETAAVGPYTVTALAGNHPTCVPTCHFLISDGQKRLFYGLDGAWLLYDEVLAIQKSGVDFAVFDGTVGTRPGDYRIFEHNNLAMVTEMAASLRPYIKRCCISHLARTLHESHEAACRFLRPYGIEVAFDGWKTDI